MWAFTLLFHLIVCAYLCFQDPPADFYEPPEFKGLLFYDGVDSLGRPVVVVDFDAVAPSTTRAAVMQYILQRLEPIVSQVLLQMPLSCSCSPLPLALIRGSRMSIDEILESPFRQSHE